MSTESKPHLDSPISSQTILLSGITLYVIAVYIKPEIILILSAIFAKFIPYAYRLNDDASERRKFWKIFEEDADNLRPKEWKDVTFNNNPNNYGIMKEEYWVNKRGMCLMTSTSIPKDGNIKGVAFFCHGYCDNASFVKRVEYQRYVKNGIALVTIEYEGHGRSDGLNGLICNWENVIDDTTSFFKHVMDTKFPGLKYFLVGESMGGAVAYYTYNRNPSLWSGVIFVAPMCKVSDELLPPKFIVDMLQTFCGDAGSDVDSYPFAKLPIAPTKDVQEFSFKLKEKAELAYTVPFGFGRKPRLATARELLEATRVISKTCKDFDAPFLIQHGLDDKVTCPKLSQLLYDEAKSTDKEIKLYEGMWHTLTSGETKENIDIVFNDAISWLLARV